MVKAIGCLFLLSACSLGGLYLSSRIQEEERLVQTLLKFFRGIEGELTYGGAPVGELLQQAAQDPRFAGLDFLPLCCRGMETGDFSASFCSAVEECRCLQKSPSALRQLMLDFGREFGTSPAWPCWCKSWKNSWRRPERSTEKTERCTTPWGCWRGWASPSSSGSPKRRTRKWT